MTLPQNELVYLRQEVGWPPLIIFHPGPNLEFLQIQRNLLENTPKSHPQKSQTTHINSSENLICRIEQLQSMEYTEYAKYKINRLTKFNIQWVGQKIQHKPNTFYKFSISCMDSI